MASFYEIVGLLTVWGLVAWLLCKIAKGLWTNGLGAALGFAYQWKVGENSWAVVTGSTDGIGLEYAKQMASKGYNVLLISRNPEKLSQTKELIKAKYPKCKEIQTLAVDFGKTDIYGNIEKELRKLGDIDVLVNNVGVSQEFPEYFTKIENRTQLIENMININIVSCTRMIDLVLPEMEKRKRGVIINISSMSGSYPSPLLTVYAASKVYVDFLSRALNREYSDKGIVIQSILPAFVQTKMSKIRKPTMMAPSPATYVRSALNTLGIESRSYGYWAHKLQGFGMDSVVQCVMGSDYNSQIIFNSLKAIRKKAYKRSGMKED
ncbi:hydroxysteroid dehydrogenase-like protein 5 [Leptotrombidium deliense]|uniref:Hydroxysteroid dehydrogenase-like protein 5 n=1 Tax=Leptotrombidium deliense TaxID=299467 RepID=A0A443S4M5_9ACAR|nr:hydroxysteroid dehydrogenase-like protein 5 [Leptotrombidium deliense]